MVDLGVLDFTPVWHLYVTVGENSLIKNLSFEGGWRLFVQEYFSKSVPILIFF